MKHGNFTWIIVALLIFLVGAPIADEFDTISAPWERALTFSCLLGIGVVSLRGGGRLFVVAMTVAVVGIILNIAAVQLDALWLNYGALVAIMAFLVIAIYFTFKRVAIDAEISVNRIVGAVAVYLMLGVLWAVAYTIVDFAWPGSFSGFDPGARTDWASEWLYFSFVTMTTLGYGDIVPVSSFARALAYMQAVFGQLYIAILVAGLVGAYIARKD